MLFGFHEGRCLSVKYGHGISYEVPSKDSGKYRNKERCYEKKKFCIGIDGGDFTIIGDGFNKLRSVSS